MRLAGNVNNMDELQLISTPVGVLRGVGGGLAAVTVGEVVGMEVGLVVVGVELGALLGEMKVGLVLWTVGDAVEIVGDTVVRDGVVVNTVGTILTQLRAGQGTKTHVSETNTEKQKENNE